MNQKKIEQKLAAFPVCEYAFVAPSDLSFSDKVRTICKQECEKYGTSWSCPPAVGTVEACQNICLAYEAALLFTTVTEVEDLMNMEQMLKTRKDHEQVTREIKDLFLEEQLEVLVLSAESCEFCETCTYPVGACRYPDKMLPCIESYGILVTEAAERYGISFFQEGNMVTWFSLLFFRQRKAI